MLARLLPLILSFFGSFVGLTSNVVYPVVDMIAHVRNNISQGKNVDLSQFDPSLLQLLSATIESLNVVKLNSQTKLTEGKEYEKWVPAFCNYLSKCSPSVQDALIHKLASCIVQELAKGSDHELTPSEADTLVQLAVAKLKVQNANG